LPVTRKLCAAPPPRSWRNPAQRAKLPGEVAKAECHAGHSREASTAFSEACTTYLLIMSRIGANAFEHFRRAALRSAPSSSRCQRDMSLRISLTLHFRSPDAQVPPQWSWPVLRGNVSV